VASIVDLLLKAQLIDDRTHDAVLSRAKSRSGGHIVQQVAEMGLATEGTMARAISVELSLPRVDLNVTPPEQDAVNLLDGRTCAERFIVPIALREKGELLWIAMADPTDQDSIALVRRKTQKRVKPTVAGPSEILRAVRQIYAAVTSDTKQPEVPPDERLSAIELDSNSEEQVEIVNVMDETAAPATAVSLQEQARKATPAAVARIATPPPVPRTATPPPPPRTSTPAGGTPALSLADLFATTKGGEIGDDDLSEEDLATLEALRQSMEKAVVVLRALAQLCVEKGVFTRDEMGRKRGEGSG
jgi:hypothetical protein